MRAVLRYTDCMQDGRKVFLALAKMGIRVLETKKCGIHPEITVFVENREKLNKLIALLNQNCTYEVSIVKTRTSATFAAIMILALILRNFSMASFVNKASIAKRW